MADAPSSSVLSRSHKTHHRYNYKCSTNDPYFDNSKVPYTLGLKFRPDSCNVSFTIAAMFKLFKFRTSNKRLCGLSQVTFVKGWVEKSDICRSSRVLKETQMTLTCPIYQRYPSCLVYLPQKPKISPISLCDHSFMTYIFHYSIRYNSMFCHEILQIIFFLQNSQCISFFLLVDRYRETV